MKVITQWFGWGWFSVFVHGDVLWLLVYERTNGQNHAYIYMALMLAYILIYIYIIVICTKEKAQAKV